MNLPDLGLIAAPLAAGLLVTATHVPLGRRVLERGIIFIDLSIAQVAALGVIIASTLGLAPESGVHLSTQLAAASAALLAALLLSWTERRFRVLQEALIGSLYVLAACVSILVLARNPHGAEHLQDLLTGQILWVTWGDLGPSAAVCAALLTLWFAWAQRIPALFYVIFAIAVMIAVQLVGVYLVFATLILPAIGSYGLSEKPGIALGYGHSALAYAAGLIGSLQWDLPAGPLIVCALALIVVVSGVIRHVLSGPAART